MTIIKVTNNERKVGIVDVENWANPKTQIVDFVDEKGNIKPEYKDDLNYIEIEEI